MNWKEFFNKDSFTDQELNEAHRIAERQMLKARTLSDKFPHHEGGDLHRQYQASIEIMGTIDQIRVYPELAHKFIQRIEKYL